MAWLRHCLAALWATLLLAALPVHAGSAEDPEVSDAAGDSGLGPDVVAVWFEDRLRDDDPGHRISLQLGHPIGIADRGVVDITWRPVQQLDPQAVLPRQGIRFSYALGSVGYQPIEAAADGYRATWASTPADGTPADGLMAGWLPAQLLTEMQDVVVESRIQTALPADDEAHGSRSVAPGGSAQVVAQLPPPAGRSVTDPVEDALDAHVDMTEVWVDETDGIVVVVELRDLDLRQVARCEWWRLHVFALEYQDKQSLMFSAHVSLHNEAGAPKFFYGDASITRDTHSGDEQAGYEVGDGRDDRHDTEYDMHVAFLPGADGLVQLRIPGAVWDGRGPVGEEYFSVTTSCDRLGQEQKDNLRGLGMSSLAEAEALLPGPSPALVVVVAVALLALRRR